MCLFFPAALCSNEIAQRVSDSSQFLIFLRIQIAFFVSWDSDSFVAINCERFSAILGFLQLMILGKSL